MRGSCLCTFPPILVLPFLSVGDAHNSTCEDHLSQAGITDIVSIVSRDRGQPSSLKRKRMVIQVLDSDRADLTNMFRIGFSCIENARLNAGHVLVHCNQGYSRSPTLAIAYLMYQCNVSFRFAYGYVNQKISINTVNFYHHLVAFETHLNTLRKEKGLTIVDQLPPCLVPTTLSLIDVFPEPTVIQTRKSCLLM